MFGRSPELRTPDVDSPHLKREENQPDEGDNCDGELREHCHQFYQRRRQNEFVIRQQIWFDQSGDQWTAGCR